MAKRMRIKFNSPGFREILFSPGVDSLCHSVAVKRKASLEAKYKVPYKIAQVGRTRSVYSLRPEKEKRERRKNLTHEQWMKEVWPEVGGDVWRPR